MGIELMIRAENAAELGVLLRDLVNAENAIAAVSRIDPEGKVVATTAEVPKRSPRKSKADEGNAPTSSTDDAAPSSGTPSTQTEPGPSDQEDEPKVEYADVQTAVTALAAARGRDAVVEVFTRFGVDHGTKLKPEQYVDAVAELEKAREAA